MPRRLGRIPKPVPLVSSIGLLGFRDPIIASVPDRTPNLNRSARAQPVTAAAKGWCIWKSGLLMDTAVFNRAVEVSWLVPPGAAERLGRFAPTASPVSQTGRPARSITGIPPQRCI